MIECILTLYLDNGVERKDAQLWLMCMLAGSLGCIEMFHDKCIAN